MNESLDIKWIRSQFPALTQTINGKPAMPILTVSLEDELVSITIISVVSNTAVHSNAFGKLFDMIVVTFFALGASFYFFYTLIFSNYCHISSSTALSPVQEDQQCQNHALNF